MCGMVAVPSPSCISDYQSIHRSIYVMHVVTHRSRSSTSFFGSLNAAFASAASARDSIMWSFGLRGDNINFGVSRAIRLERFYTTNQPARPYISRTLWYIHRNSRRAVAAALPPPLSWPKWRTKASKSCKDAPFSRSFVPPFPSVATRSTPGRKSVPGGGGMAAGGAGAGADADGTTNAAAAAAAARLGGVCRMIDR